MNTNSCSFAALARINGCFAYTPGLVYAPAALGHCNRIVFDQSPESPVYSTFSLDAFRFFFKQQKRLSRMALLYYNSIHFVSSDEDFEVRQLGGTFVGQMTSG